MIKHVTDAIAGTLFQEFGSDYEIYTEQVAQGLTEPCFLVRCLNPTMSRDFGQRYRRSVLFAIQYFSPADEKMADCAAVLERLFAVLHELPVYGRVIHAQSVKGQVEDGVLTCTVRYDMFVLREIAAVENMEVLTIESEASESKG